MFNNIAVHDFLGIDRCELTGLGKFNIICGKNNSGKTTIMRALNQKSKRLRGITFTTDVIDQFCKKFKSFGSKGIKKFNQAITRVVKNGKQVWYGNEYQQFYNRTRERFPYEIEQDSFNKHYQEMFRIVIDSELISPKRNLESLVHTTVPAKEVHSSGQGILERLFFYQNSLSGSDENNTFKIIKEAFSFISGGMYFEISADPLLNQIELKFSHDEKIWRNAEDSGLGMQDLIIILTGSFSPIKNLILIEEPENHIHPEIQRKLLYLLKEEVNKQFIFTTHSSVIMDESVIDSFYMSSYDGNKISIENVSSKAKILGEIGYSVNDNLVSDLVVLIEGPQDKPVIMTHLQKLGVSNKYVVKCWPLGGDIMSKVDLSVFVADYKVIALVDYDPGSSKERTRFIRNCEKFNIPVTRLSKYSIENYFPLRALREVYSAQIPEDIKEINPHEKLEKQIGFDVKKRSGKIADLMTIEEIEDTEDYYEFLLSIKQYLEKKD